MNFLKQAHTSAIRHVSGLQKWHSTFSVPATRFTSSNLEKTVEGFNDAAKFLTDLAANGGTILFVGTKRTSREAIVEEAKRAGMPYVDQRWLGGMLTKLQNS